MRICLYEDQHVLGMEPLTLTRPVFDLVCGRTSLADKQWRHFGAGEKGVLIRPMLIDVQREAHSARTINDPDWMRGGPIVLVNGRWLPPFQPLSPMEAPHVGLVDGEPAYALLSAEQAKDIEPDDIEHQMLKWQAALPTHEAGGHMVRHLWELVDLNGEQLLFDFEREPGRAESNHKIAVVGPREGLHIDPTAHIDPMVVADTINGPVVIDREAVVTAFTRLEGPCYIGPGSQVHGAKIRAGTTLGPQCRIGGEIEASIILGYSNKYHEGFLGHSYVGEWVNLGAGTYNSDLRNDYGEVKMVVEGRLRRTHRNKVGSMIGDHTKAGLGTLLNTGTNAGIFCNLLPTEGLLPKYVPSFGSVWNGRVVENTDLPRLLTTAMRVMERRGRELTPAYQKLCTQLVRMTAEERRRAILDAEQRRLRRNVG